ncbi:hypothetical protein Mapa_018672 [Marchantia paleacea]|nr:hypothetical protein Mapa_018672 [Marchantia paleacea]
MSSASSRDPIPQFRDVSRVKPASSPRQITNYTSAAVNATTPYFLVPVYYSCTAWSVTRVDSCTFASQNVLGLDC